MNRNEYEPTIKQAAADLAVAAADFTAALKQIEDGRRGLPGSSFGSGGSGGGVSRPVETALGLAGDEEPEDVPEGWTIHPDLAQARLDELATLLPRIAYDVRRLRTIVVGNTPHAPTDKQRREVERTNEHKILCEHCTKWRGKGMENEGTTTGDVGGRIKPLVLCLCTYCYEFVRRTDRLPFKADVERNEQGLPARPRAGATA